MTPLLYVSRRQQVARSNTPLIIRAFDAVQQTNDSSAPFIQEANFLYLTGITEPGWIVMIDASGKSTLIAPDISESHRIFDGGLSNEQAQEVSGVDAVMGQKEGLVLMKKLITNSDAVYTLGPNPHEKYFSFAPNPGQKTMYDFVKKHAKEVVNIRKDMAKMRSIKQAEEIETMRRAIDRTCSSFSNVKRLLKSAKHEYTIDAEFTYSFRSIGATHAYEPIVAADKNACTLHYQKNNMELPNNGLILLDVGARVDGYCADITRTYAIGTPTARQVAVHAAVEDAHRRIIKLIKPGGLLTEYQKNVDTIMKDALQSLGLLKSRSDEKTYRKYFPHAIGHGLGLDVHESLGGFGEFKPGMVLTVEPGIYIPEEGIGVRIEDNILVTNTGYENLSAALPTGL